MFVRIKLLAIPKRVEAGFPKTGHILEEQIIPQ